MATISSGLASKPTATVFAGMASKPVTTVFSSLASKLVAMVSLGLASKPTIGFLVESQNQGGGGIYGLCLKTDSSGLVVWATKSPRRFVDLASKPSGFRFVGCAIKPTYRCWRRTHIEI
jgi:hypothetical protein